MNEQSSVQVTMLHWPSGLPEAQELYTNPRATHVQIAYHAPGSSYHVALTLDDAEAHARQILAVVEQARLDKQEQAS